MNNVTAVIVALLNVITIGGIIIWVEATAWTGSRKQTVGFILIVIGIIIGLLSVGFGFTR